MVTERLMTVLAELLEDGHEVTLCPKHRLLVAREVEDGDGGTREASHAVSWLEIENSNLEAWHLAMRIHHAIMRELHPEWAEMDPDEMRARVRAKVRERLGKDAPEAGR